MGTREVADRSNGKKTLKEKSKSKSKSKEPKSKEPAAKKAEPEIAATEQSRPEALSHPMRRNVLVPHEQVTVRTDPAILPDEPRDSDGLFELVPQVARRALDVGLSSREQGFHVFIAADPAVMIEDDVLHYAERFAQSRPQTPDDILYVHDFDHPEAPVPLLLPAGNGPLLVEAMDELINALKDEVPALAESEEVRSKQQELAHALEKSNREALSTLEHRARGLGFGVRTVKGGVQTYPVLHGKPLSPEQIEALDERTRKGLADAENKLAREVENAASLVSQASERYALERDEVFSRAIAILVDQKISALEERFASFHSDVASYLSRVRVALIDDWEDLLTEADDDDDDDKKKESRDHDPELAQRLERFRVNLLVSHEPSSPAQVLYETNPTYPKLFGYLERRARYGALVTDFTRIRAGSLHRASGGVLVVRAADVLQDPILWERLKRVLRERRIGAEDPLGPLGLYATTLRPVPVAIKVRIVLVGRPELYAALLEADPDFAALFRVKVEIEPDIDRTPDAMVKLDAYLMAMARERQWGTWSREARARLLDLATRLAGDQQKLALMLTPLEETAAFACAIAAARVLEAPRSGSAVPFRASIPPPANAEVTREDVDAAWHDRRQRLGAAERHLRELALRGEVRLDTDGQRVGVVNGLSVFSTGDVEFGQPMRITAVVALGREGIVDVEHEAQLGGAIHTKGVAIVRGYLSRMFGQERPLSLRAQIAFEQSYGEIDGDSASSAELFAVLSALAEIPIDQGIAVTGSVNQLGEIQAIGGLCAKIEGFYDLCAARGLTGAQAVLLPQANLPHLVLREDVASAVEQGQFHLYAARTVAEGIEVLTGVPAGERDASGRFPAESVFGRAERRLIELAERLREAEGGGTDESSERESESAGGEYGSGLSRRATPLSNRAVSVLLDRRGAIAAALRDAVPKKKR